MITSVERLQCVKTTKFSQTQAAILHVTSDCDKHGEHVLYKNGANQT